MKAIHFSEYGGPEVLKFEEVEDLKPRPGEVLVKVGAVGVNYADIMRRRGIYIEKTPLPFILGAEIAGTVTEVGEGVNSVHVGYKVAALIGKGGYAEYVVVPASALISVPRGMNLTQAAAIPLQGLTAYHILKTSARLQQGESVLVHAAAGGVGTLAVQLAKEMGAGKVIATASTQEKLNLALTLGADVGINYSEPDWPEKVLEATGGKGVDIILEMAGGKVFEQGFDCLAGFGRVVTYGSASGVRGVINTERILPRCQTVVGFYLGYVTTRPQMYGPSLTELLNFISSGRLKVVINHTYPLAESQEAHRQLESRQTTGKIVLEV